MEASMTLPFPTGIEVNFTEIDKVAPLGQFLQKYKELFDRIAPDINNAEGKTSPDKMVLDLRINSVRKIELLKEFLNEIQTLQVPSQEYYYNLVRGLNEMDIIPGITVDHIPDLLNKLKRVADRHNLYFDTMSKYNLTSAVNNYTLYSMYKISLDPANLSQAQTSVD